jgi:hypothetical protein
VVARPILQHKDMRRRLCQDIEQKGRIACRVVVYVNRAANSDWLKTGGMISP